MRFVQQVRVRLGSRYRVEHRRKGLVFDLDLT